jgi:two-component system, LytTR family, sensor kinase
MPKQPRPMTSKNRTTIYLLCQIVGWGTYNAVGLFFFAQSDPEVRLHWKRSASVFACSALIAILTTHCYRFYVRRRGWLQLPVGQAFLRLLASSLVLGSVAVALVALVWFLFGIGDFKHFGWVFPALLSWTWIVFVWNLLYFGAHYFDAYRRVQMEKLQLSVVAKEAQLQRLVAQINPHFMFNCLNSLRALITEDPRRAQTMVTELSELLRYSLQSGKALTVPLRAEMEMADTYLKLEAIRFEERLDVHLDIAPQTLDLPIPSMLVQCLVENGVKHGVEKLPQGGQIRVSSQLENDSLRIQVLSSGQLSANTNSTGIGLDNARERLRLLYGNHASLTVENQGPKWVRAEILVPVEQKQ